jgi:hypothetical protein
LRGENICAISQNNRKTVINSANLAKIPLSLDSTWNLKPPIAMSDALELETPVIVVGPPSKWQNFALLHQNEITVH